MREEEGVPRKVPARACKEGAMWGTPQVVLGQEDKGWLLCESSSCHVSLSASVRWTNWPLEVLGTAGLRIPTES